jgi:hypothetical protein
LPVWRSPPNPNPRQNHYQEGETTPPDQSIGR